MMPANRTLLLEITPWRNEVFLTFEAA